GQDAQEPGGPPEFGALLQGEDDAQNGDQRACCTDQINVADTSGQFRNPHGNQDQGQQTEGDVEQEYPSPPQTANQESTNDRTEESRGRGHGRPYTHGCTTFGDREDPVDYAQGLRIQQGPTDSLYSASHNEQLDGWGKRTGCGGSGKDCHA